MNPITLLVTINAHPGKGEKLARLVASLSLEARAEPGNICYRSFRTSGDSVVIFEQWQDQDALDKHNEAPHLKRFFIDSADHIADEVDEIVLAELC
jgi:quinol monooxygenase YgiN